MSRCRPVVIAAVAALWLAGCPRAKQAPATRYQVPSGFSGWVFVEFDVPGAPPLPTRDGVRVVSVPASGFVQTASSFGSGTHHDSYAFVTPDGQRTPIDRQFDDFTVPDGGLFAAPVVVGGNYSSVEKAPDGRTRELYSFHVGRALARQPPGPPPP